MLSIASFRGDVHSMRDYGDMLTCISALPLARKRLDIADVTNLHAKLSIEELNATPGWGHSDLQSAEAAQAWHHSTGDCWSWHCGHRGDSSTG